ncbi:adenylate kinase [Nakamurella endophytica]|uniref:Adenylate kinase n=1 Tax=Nakamurella endophytica TaxID=1748367 RepID=A0A917WD48_9ACTN|nr:adenylate kinase [Nakamurella endophytica]
MLVAQDPLAYRPCRLLVAGTSGAGKTTLAQRIAAVLQIGHVEIDALHHGIQWTPRPTFAAEVAALAAEPTWVTEWQYSRVRPLLATAADTMVWLDLGRGRVMWQVTTRTLRRRLLRQQLWNGNVEPPLHTFFTDKDHIVRWAWRTHAATGQRVRVALQQRPGLPVVRLRSHAEADAWLAGPLTDAARRPLVE